MILRGIRVEFIKMCNRTTVVARIGKMIVHTYLEIGQPGTMSDMMDTLERMAAEEQAAHNKALAKYSVKNRG